MDVPEVRTLGNSASKVSISPQAIAMYNGPMSQKKKRDLRRAHIIAYIKSKPVGTRIKIEELMHAANFKTAANADFFIKRMVRDKIITKTNLTPRTYCYSVVDDPDLHTVKGPDPRKLKYTVGEVEALAKEFAWANHEKHNDLRSFIESLKEQHGRKETTTANSEGNDSGVSQEGS